MRTRKRWVTAALLVCAAACRAPTESLPSKYLRLSVGDTAACGVAADHTLWCWGQLPLGAAPTPTPQRLGNAKDWESVQVLPWGICALNRDGALSCLGNDDRGTLGLSDGEHDPKFPALMPVAGTGALQAFSGSDTLSCGVRRDGTLWCWGDGTNGPRFTDGPRPLQVLRPVQVGTDTSWATVAVDSKHLCGLHVDHTLWCENDNDKVAFQQIDPAPGWVSLTATPAMICGTKSDGALWCLPGGVPTRLAPTAPWASVTMGLVSFCGLQSDGSLWCWGGNEFGELGTETPMPSSADPVRVGTSHEWTSISAGRASVCGLQKDGSAWCWGDNSVGTLGDGLMLPLVPVRIGEAQSWQSVSVGDWFTCGLDHEGARWCWGGQFSAGTQAWIGATQLPTLASASEHWRRYRVRHVTGVGVRDDGAVDAAFLGLRRTDHTANWSDVAAGESFYCALSTDGHLACAGDNAVGQLGTGGTPTTTQDLLPIEGTWTQIAAGVDDACALRSDGRLACWGNNQRNGFAPSSVKQAMTPLLLEGLAHVSAMAVDDGITCAISDGALSCWGTNRLFDAQGFIGQPAPFPVSGPWTAIALARDHGCALKADHTLWCFGANDAGQLGDGTREIRSAPVRLAGTDWASISTAEGNSCGQKLDGSLWCWGSNVSGRRGDGTAWRTTPRRVATALIR